MLERVPLDESQRYAASAKAPALIIAGPGTGKTSTLIGRIAYLVEERGVSPDAILALTFSNKAAREMRERLAVLFRLEESAETALAASAAMPTVSTVHAFCADLLRRYAPVLGLRPDFRLISEAEGYFLLRQAVADLVLHHYQPLAAPALHFPALLMAISRAKDELTGPERYADFVQSMLSKAETAEERTAGERALEVALVYQSYQNLLQTRGDVDFGDLIRLAVQLLTERTEILEQIRSQYQQILVDEFQDINRAMGMLLRTLSGGSSSLWAVGDADQAIYRFRGASPANLAQFSTDYPEARIETLHRNYRSAPEILAAAAGVAGALLGDTGTPLVAARTKGRDTNGAAAITLATASNETSELSGVGRHIAERASKGWSYSDQVVLCRTRRQCQRVASALAAQGIPSVTATSALEKDGVKDILAVLSLLGDASGSGLLRAGNIPDHAFSKQEAQAVLAVARSTHQTPLAVLLGELDTVGALTPAGHKGLSTLVSILSELRQASSIFIAISRYIFSYTRIGQHMIDQVFLPAGTQRGGGAAPDSSSGVDVASVAQLLALARTFLDQQRRRDEASGWNSLVDWTAFLDYVRVVMVLRQETTSLEDGQSTAPDSVRVLTVHGSKGLEFPVVYLPGLADRRFPMQRRGTSIPLPLGLSQDELFEARDPDAHLAEEACLFYVALTRARDELVLSRAEYYGRMRYKESPFLQSIRDALGERLAIEHWIPRNEAASDGTKYPSSLESEVSTFVPSSWATRSAGPVRHSEVETYQRCPRQYAYRYVYRLQPREIGLATLRRALHASLHRLELHFAEPRQRGNREKTAPLSLHDALQLFDNEWAKRLEQEGHTQGAADRVAGSVDEDLLPSPDSISGDPFLPLYLRHGRQVMERAWKQLADRWVSHSDDEMYSQDINSEPPHFEEQVTLQIKGRELSMVLDRVERGAAPQRLVRHRLGSNNPDKLDLHALFYALAAQESGPEAAELYSHNLTTGEMDRVRLDARRIGKLQGELETALAGIEGGIFPPRPDPNICQNCPFLLICPA